MTERKVGKDVKKDKQSRPREKAKIGAMDIILIIVGISLLAFTVAMMVTFNRLGAVPDTLITCVYATLGGECGVMGWIKTSKDRNRTRRENSGDDEFPSEG